MKHILLIRHAKTESSGYDQDRKRALTDRGYSDIEIMAKQLKKTGFIPERILVSPSKRTLQTCKHLVKNSHWPGTDILEIDDFYPGDPSTMFDHIRQTPPPRDRICLIGHNPGMTELFNILSSSGTDHLPTSGMGLFSFDVNTWQEILPESGRLVWYGWPSMFK